MKRYLPMALGAAILLWIIIRALPKPGRATSRNREMDKALGAITN